MQNTAHLISDPLTLFGLNGTLNNPTTLTRIVSTRPYCSFHVHVQKTIICASNRRKQRGFEKSSKLMLESACIVASKLGLLPPPLMLMLREIGGGNGGGTGFWNGFGWGNFDGWKRRRKTKYGIVGIVVICCVVLCLVLGKELVIDADFLLGGLGLLLFGLSVDGWRKGAKDWILGFCCCAFLGVLVLKREDFRNWVKCFGTVKKNGRGRKRVF